MALTFCHGIIYLRLFLLKEKEHIQMGCCFTPYCCSRFPLVSVEIPNICSAAAVQSPLVKENVVVAICCRYCMQENNQLTLYQPNIEMCNLYLWIFIMLPTTLWQLNSLPWKINMFNRYPLVIQYSHVKLPEGIINRRTPWV